MNAENPRAGEQKPTIWVAIYARKSGDENLNGVMTSIESQQAACRSYIQIQKENGWQEYPEVFDDPAESGKSLNRPSMQRLLTAVQQGRVQIVIAYKVDRLTRNSRDFHHLVDVFEKHNVGLVSATESIDTKSPQGRLMTYIMVQFAQYDRELDQERSKDFHLARARKGLWCGGLPPLGYDYKDKRFVVNESEAKLVKRVFALYLEHRSAARVAEELNGLGFHQKQYQTEKGRLYGGHRFGEDSVVRILRRKVYVGKIVNERTGLEFPGQHQPIVEFDAFDKAQEIMAEQARHERTEYSVNKNGFILKGLARCGNCGSALVGYVRPKKNKVYRYYRCMAEVDGTPVSCDFVSIVAESFEEMVLQKLEKIGWDKSFLERLVLETEKHSKEKVAGLAEERREFDLNLARTQKELGNLRKAWEGCKAASLEEEIRKLELVERELSSHTTKLKEEIRRLESAGYDVDSAQKVFRRIGRIAKRLPLDQRMKVVRVLVRRVRGWKDRVELDLNDLSVAGLKGLLTQALGREECIK